MSSKKQQILNILDTKCNLIWPELYKFLGGGLNPDEQGEWNDDVQMINKIKLMLYCYINPGNQNYIPFTQEQIPSILHEIRNKITEIRDRIHGGIHENLEFNNGLGAFKVVMDDTEWYNSFYGEIYDKLSYAITNEFNNKCQQLGEKHLICKLEGNTKITLAFDEFTNKLSVKSRKQTTTKNIKQGEITESYISDYVTDYINSYAIKMTLQNDIMDTVVSNVTTTLILRAQDEEQLRQAQTSLHKKQRSGESTDPPPVPEAVPGLFPETGSPSNSNDVFDPIGDEEGIGYSSKILGQIQPVNQGTMARDMDGAQSENMDEEEDDALGATPANINSIDDAVKQKIERLEKEKDETLDFFNDKDTQDTILHSISLEDEIIISTYSNSDRASTPPPSTPPSTPSTSTGAVIPKRGDLKQEFIDNYNQTNVSDLHLEYVDVPDDDNSLFHSIIASNSNNAKFFNILEDDSVVPSGSDSDDEAEKQQVRISHTNCIANLREELKNQIEKIKKIFDENIPEEVIQMLVDSTFLKSIDDIESFFRNLYEINGLSYTDFPTMDKNITMDLLTEYAIMSGNHYYGDEETIKILSHILDIRIVVIMSPSEYVSYGEDGKDTAALSYLKRSPGNVEYFILCEPRNKEVISEYCKVSIEKDTLNGISWTKEVLNIAPEENDNDNWYKIKITGINNGKYNISAEIKGVEVEFDNVPKILLRRMGNLTTVLNDEEFKIGDDNIWVVVGSKNNLITNYHLLTQSISHDIDKENEDQEIPYESRFTFGGEVLGSPSRTAGIGLSSPDAMAHRASTGKASVTSFNELSTLSKTVKTDHFMPIHKFINNKMKQTIINKQNNFITGNTEKKVKEDITKIIFKDELANQALLEEDVQNMIKIKDVLNDIKYLEAEMHKIGPEDEDLDEKLDNFIDNTHKGGSNVMKGGERERLNYDEIIGFSELNENIKLPHLIKGDIVYIREIDNVLGIYINNDNEVITSNISLTFKAADTDKLKKCSIEKSLYNMIDDTWEYCIQYLNNNNKPQRNESTFQANVIKQIPMEFIERLKTISDDIWIRRDQIMEDYINSETEQAMQVETPPAEEMAVEMGQLPPAPPPPPPAEEMAEETAPEPAPPPPAPPVALRRNIRERNPPKLFSDEQESEPIKTKVKKVKGIYDSLKKKERLLKKHEETISFEIKKKTTVLTSKKYTQQLNKKFYKNDKNKVSILTSVSEHGGNEFHQSIMSDVKKFFSTPKSTDDESVISFRKETREKLNVFPEILQQNGFEYNINEIAKLSTKQELGKYLEQMVKFDLSSITDDGEKKLIQNLINDILYESIRIDSRELPPEEKDMLEQLLIEKINTDFFNIPTSEIRGVSFPVSEADQFKDTWGVTLFNAITDNQDASPNSFKCYQCQQPFLSRVNDSKVEMEHKIPCITFAERVPYIGYFKIEMTYYKLWLKFNHPLEGEDIDQLLQKNKDDEDFLQYMYRYINCVTVTRSNYKSWSLHVNNLLNKWIRNFQVFMFSEIVKNMKGKKKIEFKKKLMLFTNSERLKIISEHGLDDLSTISGRSGYQVKHQLFRRCLKACLFEYAYSHMYCNRIKTNCNFVNPGEIDGYLQTCFECVQPDGKVIKTKDANMPKNIYNVPGAIDPQTKFWKRADDMIVKDYYSNKNNKIYKPLEDGFVKTNSIMLDSNEINGKINATIDNKKLGGKYLGEHQFLKYAYSGNIDGPKYNRLSDHLQIVFQLFNKIVENVTDEDYIIDARNPTATVSIGSRLNNKVRISQEMIFYYNISKMALNQHFKFQKKLIKDIDSSKISDYISQKWNEIKSGSFSAGGKRTRKHKVKTNEMKKIKKKR
jgi:hypothetical protein